MTAVGELVVASAVEPWQAPVYGDGADASCPPLLFLQLLFGYRSLKELNASFADCFVENADAFVLLNAIFPKRPSLIVALG